MVIKCGHRGARGYKPENTLESFKKGIELGADYVELDVHMTLDNEIVVMHDFTVNRMTNGKGLIALKTLDELNQLRINNEFKIPTLQEVIDLTKGACKLNIEIKDVRATKTVIDLIIKNKIKKKVIITSNYALALILAKKYGLKTGIIRWSEKKFRKSFLKVVSGELFYPIAKFLILKEAQSWNVDYINLYYRLARRHFIKKLHKKGFKVGVWTINNKRLIEKMKSKGVDMIISDYPDKI